MRFTLPSVLDNPPSRKPLNSASILSRATGNDSANVTRDLPEELLGNEWLTIQFSSADRLETLLELPLIEAAKRPAKADDDEDEDDEDEDEADDDEKVADDEDEEDDEDEDEDDEEEEEEEDEFEDADSGFDDDDDDDEDEDFEDE